MGGGAGAGTGPHAGGVGPLQPGAAPYERRPAAGDEPLRARDGGGPFDACLLAARAARDLAVLSYDCQLFSPLLFVMLPSDFLDVLGNSVLCK